MKQKNCAEKAVKNLADKMLAFRTELKVDKRVLPHKVRVIRDEQLKQKNI